MQNKTIICSKWFDGCKRLQLVFICKKFGKCSGITTKWNWSILVIKTRKSNPYKRSTNYNWGGASIIWTLMILLKTCNYWKSELLRKEYNKYTFEVNPKANKFQIRNAVQELFNVKVLTVATMNYKPVTKDMGWNCIKLQPERKQL